MSQVISLPVPSEAQYQTEAYQPGRFHPVYIHEVYNDRYKVLRKLGFGVYSTVWLVQDLQAEQTQYQAMKVLSAECYGQEMDLFELDILHQLHEVDPQHNGHEHICHVIDWFEHDGPNGSHVCMIFPLMGQDLRHFGKNFMPQIVPGLILKRFTKQVLQALDYAHTHGVVHTDITPNNLMVRLQDEKNIEWYLEETGRILEEMKDAYEEDQHLTEDIYPEVLRAPELLIGAPWDSKVDIWALGCILLELLENRRMFFAEMPDENDDLQYEPWWHFCEINKLCGPFPKELLERGDPGLVARAFDEEGMIVPYREPRREGLDIWVEHLHGKEKENFIKMIKSMLEIDPEKRKSARDLLEEPWLTEDHFEDARANTEADIKEDCGSAAVDHNAADPTSNSSKGAGMENSEADDKQGVE